MNLRLLFLIFICFGTLGNLEASAQTYPTDTLVPVGKYSGYRLFVTNLEIVKQKSGWTQLKMDLVNTGKFPISANPKKPLIYLQTVFDYTLERANLGEFSENIRLEIAKSGIEMEPGEIRKNLKLKINHDYLNGQYQQPTVPVSQTDEKPKDSPPSGILNPGRTAKTPTQDQPDDEIVFETPEFNSQSLEEIMEAKNRCPDLVFDTIFVVNATSRSIVLSYKISNIGKGPAFIYEPGKKESEALGIRAFISGATTISKGAIPIGGSFLESGLEQTAGQLPPNQSVTGTIEVDIRKKTKYLPIVILSLDAFLKLRECDRTNNTKHILLD